MKPTPSNQSLLKLCKNKQDIIISCPKINTILLFPMENQYFVCLNSYAERDFFLNIYKKDVVNWYFSFQFVWLEH